jgi:hypothetical protein
MSLLMVLWTFLSEAHVSSSLERDELEACGGWGMRRLPSSCRAVPSGLLSEPSGAVLYLTEMYYRRALVTNPPGCLIRR